MTIPNSFNIWIFPGAAGPGSPSFSRSSVSSLSTLGPSFHTASQCFIYIHALTLLHPPFIHFFWPMTHQFVSIIWLSFVIYLYISNMSGIFWWKKAIWETEWQKWSKLAQHTFSSVGSALVNLVPHSTDTMKNVHSLQCGQNKPHSPKNWNPEIVSCSNKWCPDITVHQNKGNEDVVQVAAVHWQENEGQPRVTCLLEHL